MPIMISKAYLCMSDKGYVEHVYSCTAALRLAGKPGSVTTVSCNSCKLCLNSHMNFNNHH